MEATHAADEMGGAAAEHRLGLNAARHGEIRTRALDNPAKLEALPLMDRRRRRSALFVGVRSHVTSNCAPATAIVVSASTISSGPSSVTSIVAASGSFPTS